jgi:small subunit ribosomal protein S17
MDESINNQEAPAGETSPVTELGVKSAGTDRGRRAEKIGIVTSDKMMKTVVVRVDRLVKHPIYKRYVRKRSKFMAHNEIEGVSTGDQVRIVETRPLSARKRWRVVEVLRKASK